MLYTSVEITGISPLIMHRFSEEAELAVERKSRATIQNKDATPRDKATEFAYYDKECGLFIPGTMLYASIIAAGIFHKLGRKQVTTQSESLVPSGIFILEERCWLGTHHWEVDSRPITNQKTRDRRMCHRPRIEQWSTNFTLEVEDNFFNEDLVRSLVDDAGTKRGIGSMRPQRKGPYGRFRVTKWVTQKIRPDVMTEPEIIQLSEASRKMA